MSYAWDRMVEVLFRPFQFKKWLALTFVSLIAYGGGGITYFNVPFSDMHEKREVEAALHLPRLIFTHTAINGVNDNIHTVGWREETGFDAAQRWLALYWPWLVVVFLFFVALSVLIAWIISVLNFVYIDQVARNSGAIREPWARLKHLGTSYFLWQICFTFVVIIVIAFVIGIFVASGIAIAGPSGKSKPALWALVGFGILIFLALVIFAAVIQVLTNHFVIAVMYARNVRILQAWREFWDILRLNKGQVVLYLLMRIGLAIATSIASLFALIPGVLVAAIPGAIIAIIIFALLSAKALGAAIITGVILGLPVVCLFIFAVNFVMQPALVFLRAYPMAMLGQADPALVTIPIGPPQLRPPEETGEQGSEDAT